MMLRRVDNNNFIRVGSNNANQIVIQTWVAGAFGAQIAGTAHTWTAGQTYDLVVACQGAKYRLWIDGVDKYSNWQTDANSRHLTGTGFGLYAGLGLAQSVNVRFDDMAAFPHTYALPVTFATAAIPVILTGGSTLVSDAFPDANGVRLNARPSAVGGTPTEHTGTWTVQSNKASCSLAAGVNLVTWAAGQADVEVVCEITAPATLSARGGAETGQVYAGPAARVNAGGTTYIAARIRRDTDQIQSDEIELMAYVAGSPVTGAASGVIHKVNTSTSWNASGNYRVRLQIKGTLVHVFAGVDVSGTDEPLISWQIPTADQASFASNTRAGLYILDLDDGSVIDNLVVKAL